MKIKRAIYRTLPVLGVCFFVSMPVIPCIYDRPEEPVEMFPAEWLEYKSGMPCEGIALDIEKRPISTSEISVVKYSTNVIEETKQADFARFRASEEEYEQETAEEKNDEPHAVPEKAAEEQTEPVVVHTVPEAPEDPVETVQIVQEDQAHGEVDVFEYLRRELEAKGVGYFYDYAVCQILQESGGNPNAVSADGQDKGILQYREKYWTQPESIFDPYAQIRLYTSQVAARLNAGLSIEETISRHYTSDYVTEINWEYVNAVLQWLK